MMQLTGSLISPDNHWALIAILFVSSFLSIWLEQSAIWVPVKKKA